MYAELFQVRAQLERASSAKQNEMLNFQKAASDKTSFEYDHSISSHNTSTRAHNKVIFIHPTNNDNYKDNEPKNESASESESKNDKRKYILGAPPPRLLRKRPSKMAIALLAKSLNQRSHTFVITIEHPDTHVQIAISG